MSLLHYITKEMSIKRINLKLFFFITFAKDIVNQFIRSVKHTSTKSYYAQAFQHPRKIINALLRFLQLHSLSRRLPFNISYQLAKHTTCIHDRTHLSLQIVTVRTFYPA